MGRASKGNGRRGRAAERVSRLQISDGKLPAVLSLVRYPPRRESFAQPVPAVDVGIWVGQGGRIFFATLRGSGKVWIQSLPISRLAGRILQYGTINRKEEGSILGGIGNLLDGDGR